MNVGIVHEAVDANAGDEEAGKGEADLKGKGRRIGEPVLLGLGTSHGRSLIRAMGTREQGAVSIDILSINKASCNRYSFSPCGTVDQLTYRERRETRHLVAVDLNSGL